MDMRLPPRFELGARPGRPGVGRYTTEVVFVRVPVGLTGATEFHDETVRTGFVRGRAPHERLGPWIRRRREPKPRSTLDDGRDCLAVRVTREDPPGVHGVTVMPPWRRGRRDGGSRRRTRSTRRNCPDIRRRGRSGCRIVRHNRWGRTRGHRASRRPSGGCGTWSSSESPVSPGASAGRTLYTTHSGVDI